ncbi:CubicO group peptidase (beta-lactamase class C family) [Scopulibacillus daqui]|uniref:CubicO group peptidase (Beta-lactamase class C family) n=1 Tax=Scopulibacillus daqui TaxID=1469162 RepID=A0ABS2PZZ8_9BACL|nr:serine hydrolase [Scopulibacillus daqui]MBM7645631.1 CubicO group peptidase (beta-lactamase class C family) [Scopulibacillus daqui]
MKKIANVVLVSSLVSGSWLYLAAHSANAKGYPPPQPTIEHASKPSIAIPDHESPKSWDNPGPSSPVLHPGTPNAAGMRQEPLKVMDDKIREAINEKVMPGAVVLIARRGTIVKEQAYGYAAKYQDDQFTPMKHPVKMTPHTIFDLASISKLFTTTAAMQLCEQGKFKLDDPVAKYIPEFAKNGKEKVTIRQLMTHTSGFQPDPDTPLYNIKGSREDKLRYVLEHPLENPPGTAYTYSDLNMITLAVLVERLSGERLDQYIKEHITDPLEMKDTMFNPPAYLKTRTAATEYQPWIDRGLVWGQVHDENAWALDGVSGHAGVFSTAHDLAIFSQMMLNGGRYKGKQILKPSTVRLMETNQLPQFPEDSHGLGWELQQGWYMDALTEPTTMGHTGFTGTSIVISPNNKTIVILLTNRVHPTRNTVSTNGIRRTVARLAADAIPVAIPNKEAAWFSGYGDNLDRSMQADLPNGDRKTLTFRTWYLTDNENDYGAVEWSSDGKTWSEAGPRLTGSNQDWNRISIELPAKARYVRFRYHTDGSVNGRGWYVLNPKAIDSHGKTHELHFSKTDWQKRRD